MLCFLISYQFLWHKLLMKYDYKEMGDIHFLCK